MRASKRASEHARLHHGLPPLVHRVVPSGRQLLLERPHGLPVRLARREQPQLLQPVVLRLPDVVPQRHEQQHKQVDEEERVHDPVHVGVLVVREGEAVRDVKERPRHEQHRAVLEGLHEAGVGAEVLHEEGHDRLVDGQLGLSEEGEVGGRVRNREPRRWRAVGLGLGAQTPRRALPPLRMRACCARLGCDVLQVAEDDVARLLPALATARLFAAAVEGGRVG